MEKEVREQPFLQEALCKRLVNYASLAEELIPTIEKELNHDVRQAAVVMALRRLGDKLEQQFSSSDVKSCLSDAEISLRSDIMLATVRKSSTIYKVLAALYRDVKCDQGDFLTITQGISEVTILVSQKYKKRVMNQLTKESIVSTIDDAQAVSIRFNDAFVKTPGLVFAVTRELAWLDLNVLELASTRTELTLVLERDNAIRAYRCLQDLMEKK